MDEPALFPDDDTHTELMAATYAALQQHGYADLTMQRIGAEFQKSKSLVYQHYDGKDDLLEAFLEYLLDSLRTDLRTEEGGLDPAPRLRWLLDRLLPPTVSDRQTSFVRALTALRGHATHDPAFRARITETDRVIREYVAETIRDGMADGTFDDADPERVAAFVLTTVQGWMVHESTSDEPVDASALRAELDAYLSTRLGTEVETEFTRDRNGGS